LFFGNHDYHSTMSATKFNSVQEAQSGHSFDMFRLSKAKEVVDVSPNTLRAWHKLGLDFYERGKAVFVSKSELAAFIRAGATKGRAAA